MERVQSLGTAVSDFQAELLLGVINSGGSVKCYDGKTLFATDHKTRKSGAQSNLITKTGIVAPSTPTVAELQAAFLDSITKMLGIKNDQGKLMNRGLRKFKAIVPLAWLPNAMAAINNQVIVSGSTSETNTIVAQKRFALDVEPEPLLTLTDSFVMTAEDSPRKPLVLQQKRDIERHFRGPGSDDWDKKKLARFGVEWNGAAAPWWWQSIQQYKLAV